MPVSHPLRTSRQLAGPAIAPTAISPTAASPANQLYTVILSSPVGRGSAGRRTSPQAWTSARAALDEVNEQS